ncbi:unnamed protein product [Peniophora sp. CBMAI 1063]|nr:unnamed protein product [Peniophora sp. CBMAI 1063]
MLPNPTQYWSKMKSDRLLHLGLSGDSAQRPHEAVRTLYERDIAALSNVLSSLKAARNAHIPIHELPDEVLLEIFVVAEIRSMESSAAVTSAYTSTSASRRLSMAMICSHVCTRWRTLALTSKSLWRVIDFASTKPAWVSEALRRSTPAGLMIRVVPSEPHTLNFNELISIIKPHSHRIIDLELQLTSAQAISIRESFPVWAALGAIQRLTIHSHKDMARDGFFGQPPLASWLYGLIPSLREAYLPISMFTGRSRMLQTILPDELTSLHLTNDNQHSCPPEATVSLLLDLLTFLRRSTKLKTLTLSNALPLGRRPLLMPGPSPVRLGSLEQLEVVEKGDSCARVLDLIRYSNECSVRLVTDGDQDFRQVPRVLPLALAGSVPVWLCVELSTESRPTQRPSSDPARLVLAHVKTSPSPQQYSREVVPSHHLTFRWTRDWGPQSALCRSLLEAVPLTAVTHLVLKGPIQLSAPDWFDVLTKASAVEKLVIHSVKSGGYNLCVALGFSVTASTPELNPGGALLPLLAHLELRDCDLGVAFRVHAPEHGMFMETNEFIPLGEHILHALQARVELGAVPRELVLTNCSRIEQSWIEELKVIVPEETREWNFAAWLGEANTS